MATESSTIVQRLWNYCNVLRDDGVSYGDYVEQLTDLLFLKMADEQTKPPFTKKSFIHKVFQSEKQVYPEGIGQIQEVQIRGPDSEGQSEPGYFLAQGR